MAIIKPFLASRRFNATIGAGTGAGATFAIAATAFSNDAGAAATAFSSLFCVLQSIYPRHSSYGKFVNRHRNNDNDSGWRYA
ncbi:hypothetical protein J6TS7_40750 [Paenibacillus dendritiformis]|nr:hypothetical protein J6TS7_40750 [Paenibacillus dendritiformis]